MARRPGPTTPTALWSAKVLTRASTTGRSKTRASTGSRQPTSAPPAKPWRKADAPQTVRRKTGTSKPRTTISGSHQEANLPNPKNAWPTSSGSSPPNGWSKSRTTPVQRMPPGTRLNRAKALPSHCSLKAHGLILRIHRSRVPPAAGRTTCRTTPLNKRTSQTNKKPTGSRKPSTTN